MIIRIQRCLAGKTQGRVSLAQAGVHANALIENKALAFVVGLTAFLKVLQDAAVELENVFKPFLLHEGASFLTADATRAKHDDGFFFQRLRQTAHGFGELAEVIDFESERVFESSEFDLVVVSSVQKGERSAFVEPLLQRLCTQLR